MTDMEKPCVGSRRHDDTDFNLKEWALKARISRENTSSRRFSASNLKNFREDERSFRSNISISSTASSPGCTVREEIDPSTYSFTTALKALQAKTVYTWEFLSPDGGLVLNSKWNDAEKYICNPLSGEVPLECLSAKTLSGRSFRSLTSRITMSAPLIYPSQLQHQFLAKPPIIQDKITIQENNKKSTTRDVGTQSTPPNLSSSSPSPSPAPTPSIEERSINHINKTHAVDSSASSGKLRSDAQQVDVREGERKEEERKKMKCGCSSSHGGCLSFSFKSLLLKHKHKPRITNPHSPPFLL